MQDKTLWALFTYFASMLLFAVYSRYALAAWRRAWQLHTKVPFIASLHVDFAFERFAGDKPTHPPKNEHMLHALAVCLVPVMNTAAVLVVMFAALWLGLPQLLRRTPLGCRQNFFDWLSSPWLPRN